MRSVPGWQRMKRLFVVSVLPILLAGGAAVAEAADLTGADTRAIRRVIEAQLDAFAKDDAPKAFAYAAPPIRAMFGNAGKFLSMVKTGYPVVYRPASVLFLKPEQIDGEIFQAVQMSDADGQVWLAHYRMQRQKNRSWLINGCQLEKSDARVT